MQPRAVGRLGGAEEGGRREEPWFTLCLPCSLQPTRLHPWDQPPSRAKPAKGAERTGVKHRLSGPGETLRRAPVGVGIARPSGHPPGQKQALGRTRVPAQGREGDRMGEGFPQLFFIRELRATNRSTVKTASLEASGPC